MSHDIVHFVVDEAMFRYSFLLVRLIPILFGVYGNWTIISIEGNNMIDL